MTLRRLVATAGEFHARDLPFTAEIDVWVNEVSRPAVVLGSRQPMDLIDLGVAARRGIEVVRRRSGGTLVHLIPGEVLWVDVLVPTGHRAHRTDLRDSMIWMGQQWVAALSRAAGNPPKPLGLGVHTGAVEVSPWADLLCFGGLGPGEVTVGGSKLVGISQRRTRHGSRFQMALHRRFDAADLIGLWAGAIPPLEDLPTVVTLDQLPLSSADTMDLAGLLAEQLLS